MKGMRIEKCPKCGKAGLLLKKKTTTRKGEKLHVYEKWYVAHYLPNGLSKAGKRVNRVQWCYVSDDTFRGITQTLTQTDRQDCVTEKPSEKGSLSDSVLRGVGFEPTNLCRIGASVLRL